MNRFFDIVFSIFALLLLSPLLIPVVIVLRSGEGEVFFLQEREEMVKTLNFLNSLRC